MVEIMERVGVHLGDEVTEREAMKFFNRVRP